MYCPAAPYGSEQRHDFSHFLFPTVNLLQTRCCYLIFHLVLRYKWGACDQYLQTRSECQAVLVRLPSPLLPAKRKKHRKKTKEKKYFVRPAPRLAAPPSPRPPPTRAHTPFQLHPPLVRRWGTRRRVIRRRGSTPLPAWWGGRPSLSCCLSGLALLRANISLREVGAATFPAPGGDGYTSGPSSPRTLDRAPVAYRPMLLSTPHTWAWRSA